jgi:putative ABC transport system substrate-binding protein
VRKRLRQGLSETGYVLGQDVAIIYHWADDQFDRLPALATQPVGQKVHVILVSSSVARLAAKRATSAIPIVSFGGAVWSLPAGSTAWSDRGGNLTGIRIIGPELEPKRLDLCRGSFPRLA